MHDTPPTPFPNTRWTTILQLRSSSDVQRRRAFEDLCHTYWRPLYTLARAAGHSPHDAEDHTQGFLAQLLRREDLGPLAPEHGRLRTFLKAAFNNYLTDEARRERRLKRGGGAEILSLDMASAERQFQRLAGTEATPDQTFDRQWARIILRRALEALRERFRSRGREQVLTALEGFLGNDDAPSYAEVSASLGQTENAIAAAVRRMREEFRELLRREVADTLAAGENVDEELRYLLRSAA